MRIAVLIRCNSTGGAPESMVTLAAHLEERGHEISVFGNRRGANSEIEHGKQLAVDKLDVPTELSSLLESFEYTVRFRKEVERFDPDIVLSQFAPSVLGALLNMKAGVTHITFLRSPTYVTETIRGKSGNAVLDAGYIPIKLSNKQLFRAVRRYSDLFVANSEYTAALYQQEWDLRPAVVYPFIDVEQYRTEANEHDAILHVNPSKYKGIDVTIEVAQMMPDREFIVAGEVNDATFEEAIESTPNIQPLGYLDDMREAYRQARIGLLPSDWAEPYGRIPIEAGINGIPVLGSGKGGSKEAIGSQRLIVKSNRPEDYVQRIREVEESYEEFSSIAYENAVEKAAGPQVDKFVEVLSERVDCRL